MTAAATRPLAERRAVVTGSSRGIGRAVARALAAAGASVVVNGRVPDAGAADRVAEVVEEIRAAGGDALGHHGSVADFDAAGELVAACVDGFGGIDVLVNCAGVVESPGSSILNVTPDEWRAVLDVHLTGTFNACRHAADHFVAQRRGVIVNTSSHAFLGRYGGTAYPAAKGGTNALTLALAGELREHGVRANAVCPGARTRISTGPDYERHIRDLHARGLLNDLELAASLDPPPPEHVGPLYVVLGSDLSAPVTGGIFSAVGGYVGRLADPTETLVAYRDHATDGPWDPAALAAELAKSWTTG